MDTTIGEHETTMEEMTLQELSQETGFSMSHLSHLSRRGILPKGRRDGRNRLLPVAEVKAILAAHEPGTHWRSKKAAEPQLSSDSWDALINGNPSGNSAPALDWTHLL